MSTESRAASAATERAAGATEPATTKPPKLDKAAYEEELERLQAELVEMQQWVVETGARVVIIMEGRDAAGKGSAITVSYTHLTLPTNREV